MTAREMQVAFIRETSLINNTLEVPVMPDSTEIFYWINYAQQKYLKEMYISKASVKENVEYIQRRIEDIKQLIARITIFGTKSITGVAQPTTIPISIGNVPTNVIVVDNDGAIMLPLPSDYFYYVRSTSYINGTYLGVLNKSWIENVLIEHSDITPSILSNAINIPIIRNPLVLLETNPGTSSPSLSYMVMYKDTYTNLFDLEITYIRNPLPVALLVNGLQPNGTVETSELSFQVHQDIVDYSVKLYIEDFKYKLQTQQSKK
jgi:hypothetical protein